MYNTQNRCIMESINVVFDDVADPNVSFTNDNENSNMSPLVKTDVTNIHSGMSLETTSEAPMEINQSVVELRESSNKHPFSKLCKNHPFSKHNR